jgi:hypothetical protein
MSSSSTLGGGGGLLGDALFADVEVLDERIEVLAEDLGRLDDRHVGRDGAVGPDLEDQLVIVGLLSDAGVLDGVADALDGRVDRIDGNDADLLLLASSYCSLAGT